MLPFSIFKPEGVNDPFFPPHPISISHSKSFVSVPQKYSSILDYPCFCSNVKLKPGRRLNWKIREIPPVDPSSQFPLQCLVQLAECNQLLVDQIKPKKMRKNVTLKVWRYFSAAFWQSLKIIFTFGCYIAKVPWCNNLMGKVFLWLQSTVLALVSIIRIAPHRPPSVNALISLK